MVVAEVSQHILLPCCLLHYLMLRRICSPNVLFSHRDIPEVLMQPSIFSLDLGQIENTKGEKVSAVFGVFTAVLSVNIPHDHMY